jgi:formylglycine-generating enzyme required for sulfatase activity
VLLSATIAADPSAAAAKAQKAATAVSFARSANRDSTRVTRDRRAIITLTTVDVGAPGNAPVGIVPFTDAIYRSCADAPNTAKGCQMVGSVGYPYEIGQVDITVAQYVDFLNTVDATGRDPYRLYSKVESSTAWPKYGQIDFSGARPDGEHYSVAYPEWNDKPYGFTTFLSAARFINSLNNGRVLSRKESASGRFHSTSYRVRLSRRTETGMYDLTRPGATRTGTSGFVVPSQDEWIKAAYYDPRGSGTYSYWKYPTNPGVFGDGTATAPSAVLLNPANGDVTNAATQPLANYHASGLPAPTWCPSQVSAKDCSTVNPLGLDAATYASLYQGSLSTVGQAATLSPWGTLDQGGNAVEWTDTITPPPVGQSSARVWRRAHGGVANSSAYQMWLSAVGLAPENDAVLTQAYPWYGFRIGVIGNRVPPTARNPGTRTLAQTGTDMTGLVTLSLASLTAGSVLMLSRRRLSRKP